MPLHIEIVPQQLHFKQPAGTSRGIYTIRNVWYIIATDDNMPHYGIGECAPLHDLSCDYSTDYESKLRFFCQQTEKSCYIDYDTLKSYPSILFGLETALLHLARQSFVLYDTPLTRGETGIPINGLVWMGNYDEMLSRLEAKMQAGFRCVKLKIGAIDFKKEIDLIKHIRAHFNRTQIELRVDANCAFGVNDAMSKLEELAQYDIHSIEQPIKTGQWEEMAKLCARTPIPIALDEELIGINETASKINLLNTIKPQYIILKPSLHGGIFGSEEWIQLANNLNIGWWITSALESNIGLNAIAQWASSYNPQIPQGLGTGLLFTDNIDMPIYINGDALFIKKEGFKYYHLNQLFSNH